MSPHLAGEQKGVGATFHTHYQFGETEQATRTTAIRRYRTGTGFWEIKVSDKEKTKGQLIEELQRLRQQVAELQEPEKECKREEAERERLLTALERRSAQLQTALEVSSAVSSILDPGELIQQVVNLVRERFELYYAGLFLVDQTGEWTGEPDRWVVLRAGTGEAGQKMLEQDHKLEAGGTSMIGWCVANKQARIALDVGEEAVRFENPLLPETRSELALPLISRRQVIGAMTIQSTQEAAFSEEDIAVLQGVADQIAIAIENARAYELEREAARQLREAEGIRRRFLANMSHALREPLNNIIGFSRLILKGIDGPISEQQRSDLEIVHADGQHLLGLINDLLDVAKIEAGLMELDFREVDLGEIISSVMTTTSALVRDKDIQLRQEIHSDLPLIEADWTRLRQVLLKLLSNAAQSTERGSITVRAWPEGDSVQVAVADMGPGISKEDWERVFGRFEQGEVGMNHSQGVGLGLALCKEFVEMHGGRIWVESKVGKGSTFTFSLPLRQRASTS